MIRYNIFLIATVLLMICSCTGPVDPIPPTPVTFDNHSLIKRAVEDPLPDPFLVYPMWQFVPHNDSKYAWHAFNDSIIIEITDPGKIIAAMIYMQYEDEDYPLVLWWGKCQSIITVPGYASHKIRYLKLLVLR